LKTQYQIERYCHIRDYQILVNGQVLFEEQAPDFKAFIKSAYKSLDMDHSKFFKMDDLSKLGFMAAEMLLKNETEKEVALVFSNKASSLDTDLIHQKSIDDDDNFYPSPAVFVYTLPNICMGEISIRHKIYSENAFFIFDRFSPETLVDYTHNLLENNEAKKVLCGWIDLDHGKFDAFLYVVGENGIFAHTKEELNRLYE
jgi:hypothetical protein